MFCRIGVAGNHEVLSVLLFLLDQKAPKPAVSSRTLPMLEGQPGKSGNTNSPGEQHDNTAEGLNIFSVYTSGTGRANLLAT